MYNKTTAVCPICKAPTRRVLDAWDCTKNPKHYMLVYWREIKTAFGSNEARRKFADSHRTNYAAQS